MCTTRNQMAGILLAVIMIFAARAIAVENGRIAFTSNNTIWTMNADGSERNQIVSAGSFPKFSPNGTRIAYYRGDDVWVVNANGGNETYVAYAGPLATYRMRGLTWSPAGNRIAFTCVFGICAVNVDGSNRTTISNDSRDNEPSWSPDSSKFVFSKRTFSTCRSPDNHECFPDIYVMNADGGNQERLVLHGTFSYIHKAVWSPDSASIAFGEAFFDIGYILRMKPDGTDITYVTGGDDFDGIPAYQPSWSPDGIKIAFAGDALPGATFSTDIYVVNIDGTGLQSLGSTPVEERYPDWGPSTSVSVSGRVTGPDGRGLGNTIVSMIDSLGQRRTATTSSFGYYTFDNVRIGETYLIGVSSRRYRFSPRQLQVDGNLTDIDFVGQE